MISNIWTVINKSHEESTFQKFVLKHYHLVSFSPQKNKITISSLILKLFVVFWMSIFVVTSFKKINQMEENEEIKDIYSMKNLF